MKTIKKGAAAIVSAFLLLPCFSSCHLHQWESEIITEANCEENGEELLTCSICGKQKTKTIAAFGKHEYEAEVIEATCNTMGMTLYTCTKCGYTWEDDYVLFTHDFEENGVCTKCGGVKEGTEGLTYELRGGFYAVSAYTGTEKDVVIPVEHDGVAVLYIGENAFAYNKNIESVEIPSCVRGVENAAFRSCTSLKEVKGAEGLYYIQHRVFYGCSALTGISFGEDLYSIGDQAFVGCSALTEVTVPDTVTYLGDEAFSKCTSLTKATIGDGVPALFSKAFYLCTALKEVTVGSSCASIGEMAFFGCTNLTKVTLSEGVTSLGFLSFGECESLTSLVLPSTVTWISARAFNGCTLLSSLTFRDSADWLVYEDAQGEGEEVDLSDASAAAYLLRASRADCLFAKKESEEETDN